MGEGMLLLNFPENEKIEFFKNVFFTVLFFQEVDTCIIMMSFVEFYKVLL
mgnify:CR=1 FL=1